MTRFKILPLFSRSASSPTTCFLISYLLGIILKRKSTAERSQPIVMSSPCTVATTCTPLMQPLHTHGDAIPLVNLRSLSVDTSSSSHCVRRHPCRTSCIATARTCAHHLLFWRQFNKYFSSRWSVEVRPSHVDKCHNCSSAFTRGNTRQQDFQHLHRRRRSVQLGSCVGLIFLRDQPCAKIGFPWLSIVSLHPSRLDGCFPRLTQARLSLWAPSCTSCGDECTSPPHAWPWHTAQGQAIHLWCRPNATLATS